MTLNIAGINQYLQIASNGVLFIESVLSHSKGFMTMNEFTLSDGMFEMSCTISTIFCLVFGECTF